MTDSNIGQTKPSAKLSVGLPESGNIFLVGPMGVGKTTIGRQLAKQLHKTFLDSDHEIEHLTGADIPLIFDLEGEVGFRKRERKMINELTHRENIILATGGGVVLDPDNRADLNNRGLTVYLHACVDNLLKRTARDRNRPLLQTEDPRGKLETLIEQRDPLYREVADLIIETGNRKVREVVREILEKLAE